MAAAMAVRVAIATLVLVCLASSAQGGLYRVNGRSIDPAGRSGSSTQHQEPSATPLRHTAAIGAGAVVCAQLRSAHVLRQGIEQRLLTAPAAKWHSTNPVMAAAPLSNQGGALPRGFSQQQQQDQQSHAHPGTQVEAAAAAAAPHI